MFFFSPPDKEQHHFERPILLYQWLSTRGDSSHNSLLGTFFIVMGVGYWHLVGVEARDNANYSVLPRTASVIELSHSKCQQC